MLTCMLLIRRHLDEVEDQGAHNRDDDDDHEGNNEINDDYTID